jgi:hypothetical protein
MDIMDIGEMTDKYISEQETYESFENKIQEVYDAYIAKHKIKGVIDSLTMELITLDDDSLGATYKIQAQERILQKMAYISSVYADATSRKSSVDSFIRIRAALCYSDIHRRVKQAGGKRIVENATDKSIDAVVKSLQVSETIYYEAMNRVSLLLKGLIDTGNRKMITLDQKLKIEDREERNMLKQRS